MQRLEKLMRITSEPHAKWMHAILQGHMGSGEDMSAMKNRQALCIPG